MNASQKAYLRMRFKLLIYQRNGNSFERFFSDIMTQTYSGFRVVKPQSPIGDRKNDGFIEEEGIYYQVYAPEEPALCDNNR